MSTKKPEIDNVWSATPKYPQFDDGTYSSTRTGWKNVVGNRPESGGGVS
jgi:hypothetical protein